MRNVTWWNTVVFLLVICVALQCSPRSDYVSTGLGAIQVHVVHTRFVRSYNPGGAYDVGIILCRYTTDSLSAGWPNDSTDSYYHFQENDFELDSLEHGTYDLWVHIGADTDGDGLDELVWVPTVVTGIRVGKDSVSFAEAPTSGMQPNHDPVEGTLFHPHSWKGRIDPR